MVGGPGRSRLLACPELQRAGCGGCAEAECKSRGMTGHMGDDADPKVAEMMTAEGGEESGKGGVGNKRPLPAHTHTHTARAAWRAAESRRRALSFARCRRLHRTRSRRERTRDGRSAEGREQNEGSALTAAFEAR